MNLYGYVLNQPTRFTDASGLVIDPVSWTAAGIMCGGGAVVGAVLAGRKATLQERAYGAGVGCGVGMLLLVSWIAAAGAALVGAEFAVTSVPEALPAITVNALQLQSKFKHAIDFGIGGKFNAATQAAFEAAIRGHVAEKGTRAVEGTYRGGPAVFYTNVQTGLTVITDRAGNFISGWRFSGQQMQHLLTTGKVGGG